MISMKIIKNYCVIGNKCILEVDGKYFYYDDHEQYPEALTKDIGEAYVFKNHKDALNIISWHPGKQFNLIPV